MKATKAGAGGSSPAAAADGSSSKKRERDAEDDVPNPEREEAERSVLLRFEGAGPTADREGLEPLLQPFGKVAFIDFSRGDSSGTIRFESKEGVAAALASLGSTKPDVGGAVPTWREVTLEESKAYWLAYRERRKAQQAAKKPRGSFGGRGQRRGPR